MRLAPGGELVMEEWDLLFSMSHPLLVLLWV